MNNSNNFVIFVERGPFGSLRHRFLIRDAKTDEVKLFANVTAAAGFVEFLEDMDAFDHKDKIFVLHKDCTPDLGWHVRPWKAS